jgi:DNA-binding MarR family transcriptional regulator
MFVEEEKSPLLAVEKLLVHLAEYPELGDLELHPREMAQDGMSEAIGVSRPHVARVLKVLLGRGLVESKMAHVAGTGERRRTYFLTALGKKEAMQIDRVCNELAFTAPSVNAGSVEQFRFGARASVWNAPETGSRPSTLPR